MTHIYKVLIGIENTTTHSVIEGIITYYESAMKIIDYCSIILFEQETHCETKIHHAKHNRAL